MIIFAAASDFGWFSTGQEKDPIVTGHYNNETASTKIVKDILDVWLNNPGDIECLFLVAHGNAGVLRLGKPAIGMGGGTAYSELRGAFAVGGRGIEIHGCACASSTEITWWCGLGTASSDRDAKGYRLLRGLAEITGMKVTAPIDGLWGFNAAYSYDGVRTMTVYPSGSFYYENR